MGICISSESFEIHAIDYGHENLVHYENNNNGYQQIGSIYSHQGSKGLNQDSAILFQGFGVENGAFGGVFDGHGKNGQIVSKLVWDVLSNDQVVSIVCSTNDGAEAAKAVVEASIDAWKQKFPNTKRDDCTAICLFLQQRESLKNNT